MSRGNMTLEKRFAELERQLKETREEAKYYQRIAEETGSKRLREIDQLSKLIVELKRADEALRESEEKYRSAMEANPDPVIVYDIEGKVIYLNPAFTRIFGWTQQELLGKKMERFIPDASYSETKIIIKKLLNGESFSDFKTRRYANGGNNVYVSISGSIYQDSNTQGYIITLRDISEQMKLETQLRQAQKMEALGTLAGGIAHDFNNILSIIIGYTEIESLNATNDSATKNNLFKVLKAGRRAKELVNQILSFSRQSEHELRPIHIGPTVKEALKLLRASLPATIEIHQHIERSPGLVKSDPTQIYQVLMNLCSNAAHAMHDKGGVLKVSLTRMNPYPYLSLTVSDTGHGIAPEILERIFEPYFTTKEKGEGTGLGLAVVHGIVKSHGGTITVESEVGEGATFNVFLPRIEDAEDAEETAAFEPLPTGHERILLIDDERALVDIGKKTLECLGYIVSTETNGIEALELFREHPDNFDIVISDMTMPNMTGEKLAKEILKICPDIPIILCTGFSKEMTTEKAMAMGIREFIIKPFSIQELAKTIRKVLDNKLILENTTQ